MKDNPENTEYHPALSSRRWAFTLWEPANQEITTVVELLKFRLQHIESESWFKRLCFGGVYYNGKRILQDQRIEYPARIEYFEPKFPIEEASQHFPSITENNIIFRQSGLIAFCKPAGMPSLPSKDNLNFNLRSLVAKLLGSSASIHMPSRLDTSVSGVIVMSEDPRLHGPLQKLFEKKMLRKRYIAGVSTNPDWSKLEINLPIARDPKCGILRKIDAAFGKPSTTFVKKLPAGIRNAPVFLAVYPLTGRTHQIRLHLSAIGLPIIGDRFYGGAENKDLHLLSHDLRFRHPLSKEQIIIRLPERLRPEWYLPTRSGKQ